MTSEQFEKMVPEINKNPAAFGINGCILYNSPHLQRLACWEPAKHLQRLMGAPKGQTRVLVYALCRECCAKPDPHRLVEDKMIAERRAMQ